MMELLMIIALVGVLVALFFVAINPVKRQKQTRDFQRKQDIGQISAALKFYFSEDGNGSYPTALIQLVEKGHLKVVPKGPKGEDYSYSGGSEAAVWAVLEAPTSGSGTWFWCWRSVLDSASEQQVCSP